MADDLEMQNNINGLPQGSRSKDRLSSLHDSIIVDRILSLLPTREVVRTEILSRRWKSLWIGVSIFDFRSSVFSIPWNAVERVVALRNRSIKQFNLSIRPKILSTYPRLQSIISSLVDHNIPHLEISLYVEDQFTLPDSVFNCQSFTNLKLGIVKDGWNYTLKLPVRVSLPCLKVLQLRSFAFPNAESLEKLLSCCPVLEELALVDCKWMGWGDITISSPSIKRLTIGLEEYDNLVDDDKSRDIIIEAPALLSLNYTGFLINHFCFKKLSSSFTSFIHITNYSNDKVVRAVDNLVNFFQGLEKNIVSLTISDQTAKVLLLSLARENPILLPVLHKLKYLNLGLPLMGCDLKGLLTLFDFLPNLETVEISEGATNSIDGFRWMLSSSLPKGFSSSLRFLVLRKSIGYSYEFSFMNDFMERAFTLQRLHTVYSKDEYIEKQQRLRDILEQLSTRFKQFTVTVTDFDN